MRFRHSVTHGKLQVLIKRGAHIAALGHARLRHGQATLSLRELRNWTRGTWTITIVLRQPRRAPATVMERIPVT